ncbi:MAG: RNA 2',3'-cyclic phosphodiesterase [Acidimicrobiales bacterium]|jgi:2'-5' RNA ligase
MARLFVAVWPPDDVVAELTALPRKDRRGVRFVDPDRWHITLRFLGEADPEAVLDALDGLVPAPATVHLGPGVDVLAERALVVPVTGLDEAARDVTDRTKHLGEPPRKRFVGHLTLARIKPYADLPSAIGARVDERFELDEVALVQSRLRPEGARYETLATWPVG